MTPTTAWRGDTITISGKNFGGWGDGQTLLFDTLTVTPFFVSDAIIKAILPATLSEKSYQVYVVSKSEKVKAGQIMITRIVDYAKNISVASILPTTAWRGDTVTIMGKNFGVVISEITVMFDSIPAKIIALLDTKIQLLVPQSVTEKTYTITIHKQNIYVTEAGRVTMNSIDPKITLLQPIKAWRGDTITIIGRNFGSISDNVLITFDESSVVTAYPISVSDTVIKVMVPFGVHVGTYSIVLRILPKASSVMQQILLEPRKYQFEKAIVDVKIDGTAYNYTSTNVRPLGQSGTTSTKLDTVVSPVVLTKTLTQCPDSRYKYSTCYSNTNSGYISMCCYGLNPFGNGIGSQFTAFGNVDVVNQIIQELNISFSQADYTGVNNHSTNSSSGFNLKLQNIHFKEVPNGIQISYSGSELSTIFTKFSTSATESSYDFSSGTTTTNDRNNKFSSSTQFSTDNYIKITLYR